MKKIGITIFMVLLIIGSIAIIETSVCKLIYKKNQNETDEILRIAYDYLNNNENTDEKNIGEVNNSNELNKEENESLIQKTEEPINIDGTNIIGVLRINKLNIEAPIRDGTSQEIMRTSIGHFFESDYWNGNVSLASHNGGTNAHFFEKINTLNINDEIEYLTKKGVKKYKVQSIKKIESTDWSLVVKSNTQSENTITLITCIDKQPNYRLCVRGIEI